MIKPAMLLVITMLLCTLVAIRAKALSADSTLDPTSHCQAADAAHCPPIKAQ